MNTTLKIVMICAVCAATVMAGCLDSDDAGSMADVLGDITSVDTPSKEVAFTIELILEHDREPGVMNVLMFAAIPAQSPTLRP